jgi:hypothetical protein
MAFDKENLAMMEPIRVLRERSVRLSAEAISNLFDFDDAGHASTIAEKAAHRLWKMMEEISEIEDEIRQAIAPPNEDKAAA